MNVGSDFELPTAKLYGEDLQWPEPFSAMFEKGQTVLTDSGRSAIRLALRSLQLRSGAVILLPDYICDSVIHAVRQEGMVPQFYRVDRQLQVDQESVADLIAGRVGAIFSIPYFGFGPSLRLHSMAAAGDIPLIVDVTHALLSPALMCDLVMTTESILVASLRKLFPLPDGGLVYGRRGGLVLPEVECAAPHADQRSAAMTWKAALLQRNPGEQARPFRSTFLEAEESLDHQTSVHRISHTARTLIQALSCEEIKRRRVENYRRLLSLSQSWAPRVIPLFTYLPNGVTPLGFPVICSNRTDRDGLRSYLVQRGVFPPVHWPTEEERLQGASNASWLRERILTIPCDQRYDDGTMQAVARLVSEWSTTYGID